MRIGEVAARTGLTKKAIRYYEAQGLISPQTDPGNAYREYSQDDVQRLQEISLLRDLGLSVPAIRQVLDGEEDPADLLRRYAAQLREQSTRLRDLALIVEGSLADAPDRPGSGPTAPRDQPGSRPTAAQDQPASPPTANRKEDVRRLCARLKALRDTMSTAATEKRRGYMVEELRRIFPGPFGTMMTLLLGSFLDEPLDTPQKKEAWLSLVRYLDEVEDFKLHEDVRAALEQIDLDLERDEAEMRRKTEVLTHMSPEERDRLRARAATESTPDLDSQDALILRLFAIPEVVRVIGTVEAHLAVLNPRFRQFLDNLLCTCGQDPAALDRLQQLVGPSGHPSAGP
ncbi:MAG: MerR family transcriptional regulator [Firmicutes bacterium]|nr:MerR family transcriptional regulator [Bacillota bacterium]